jgi:putative membrane protein insertion efficiency factor
VHRQGRQRAAVHHPGRQRVRQPLLRHLTRARLVGLLLLVLAATDLTRAPEHQLSARALRGGIRLYQQTLSPLMPMVGIQCRFTPTCSRYGDAVIAKHGAILGTWRTLTRLARCGPWTAMGTVDEPR